MNELKNQFKTAFSLLLFFSFTIGILYPLLVTVFAQFIFPFQANGSLIKKNEMIIGSRLIGQSFTQENVFWSRPSATPEFPYNAALSSGSNLCINNPAFLKLVKDRTEKFSGAIPIDLLTASSSGLDPEISPNAAYVQVPRIATARHVSLKKINDLITQHIQKRTLYILGEPRVNVLELNLALENLQKDLE